MAFRPLSRTPWSRALLDAVTPRSLAGWFGACWLLFLVAALGAGAALISLYQDSTTERLRRAETSLAQGCSAIAERYRFVTAGASALDWDHADTERALTAGTLLALGDLPGVEGGLWRLGRGALAYAFPTYEGAEPKTDLPTAEVSRIRAAAEAAIEGRAPLTQRYDARAQSLLIRSCPLGGSEPGMAAWVMERVVLFGGPAYLRAAAALAALTFVLLASAAWLGWLLWGWSGRLRRIEAALSGPVGQDLPRLETTGQRDLDRMVDAVNGAAERAAEAHRAAVASAARAAEAERLAGLGRVAAGVAHEVRNPITAMRLKAENALASREPARMAGALEAVLAQVDRLERVARGLLDVSRSGTKSVATAVDISVLLARRREFFQEQADAAGVSLQVNVETSPITLLDAASIESALDNLIINAIQATPVGGAVTLSASRRGGGLVLRVDDTGRGIPEDLRAHLFEPFVTGRPEGTGLGLALVQEVARAHGGEARVFHRPDGTTISLELPQPEQPWPGS